MTSFDKEGYEALKRAGMPPETRPVRTDQEAAFKFLLAAFAEQRLAIRALNDRVKVLESSRSGDERYAEHARSRDDNDPSALEVW